MENLNDWAIGEKLFNHIKDNLTAVETILELGSGTGTIELTKHFKVYSIEHDAEWLGVAKDTNYIHAPIKDGWYDVDILKKELPQNYDLILIDGPTGLIGRGGFIKNFDLFNKDAIIIVDDVHRKEETELLWAICAKLKKKHKIYYDGVKKYAIIL